MQLTEHFSLEEFTHSDTAARLGIDNTPPSAIVETLRATARRMEHVRLILAVPIAVSSAYRCEDLERVITAASYRAWCANRGRPLGEASWREYFARKHHPKGGAVDFTAPQFGPPVKVARELARHAEELEFDQLIYEFDSWVHIGWSQSTPRRQLLTINGRGTVEGLVEQGRAA